MNVNYFKSELEAIDVFASFEARIRKKLKDYIDYCEVNYLMPEFIFDEYDHDCLIKSQFKFSKAEQKRVVRKVTFRDQVFELLKKIEWRELEKLSSIILKENHINNIKITRSRNDQGIDFYGFYKFESENFLPRFYKFLNFRIVGQVKHSEKNIGVDHQKIASFGTEINILRRSKRSSYFENLDDDFLNSELPIVGIFITNSYYPKKAIDFAKEYGIIYWNGRQIAEDLCTQEMINSILDKDTQTLSLSLLKKNIDEMSV